MLKMPWPKELEKPPDSIYIETELLGIFQL